MIYWCTQAVAKIWCVQTTILLLYIFLYTVTIYILLILILFGNDYSNLIYRICEIHFTKNTSPNLRIYNTNIKASKDFNAIYLVDIFIIYVLCKYWCPLPEDDRHTVETCRSSRALIVKILYCNVMHLSFFPCFFNNTCTETNTLKFMNNID